MSVNGHISVRTRVRHERAHPKGADSREFGKTRMPVGTTVRVVVAETLRYAQPNGIEVQQKANNRRPWDVLRSLGCAEALVSGGLLRALH